MKIAAVVVTFNRKEYLVKNIEALLAQVNAPMDILIFDNASTDGTEAVSYTHLFHDKPDQKLLYSDIGDGLTKYGNANFGGLNMGTLMQDLMDIMKENRVSMPHSLTMLVREMCIRDRNTTELKNLLIRGAGRDEERVYPSPVYGYGTLNVYDALLRLREL